MVLARPRRLERRRQLDPTAELAQRQGLASDAPANRLRADLQHEVEVDGLRQLAHAPMLRPPRPRRPVEASVVFAPRTAGLVRAATGGAGSGGPAPVRWRR